MTRTIWTTSLSVLLVTIFAFPAVAQRGVGDDVGIVRQGIHPELQRIEGKLVEIKVGPCEATTGRARIGTHLILETNEGEKVNLHLGPAFAFQELVAKLQIGQALIVDAFRTEKLAEGDMVAVRLIVGDEEVVLRDDQYRPTWAGGGQRGGGWGRGKGQGYGQGFGQGYGRGNGHGFGPGRGQGRNFPNCQGRGYGARWGAPGVTPPRVTTIDPAEPTAAK